ncbi:MoxR family ATPase [Micromonospora sp. NPDC049900]|uniref:MoxR family ATPase n=1 Tax=unclassified Micromonospora TaxID=2617518 RepID=UPI003790F253
MTDPTSSPETTGSTGWRIYTGTGRAVEDAERDLRWPAPPRWRAFDGGPDEPAPPQEDPELVRRLGEPIVSHLVDEYEVDVVNAALHLRRPLLVTGRPGTGRSSLAYRIARELRLGRVLRWPVTTQVGLRHGLYDYDAVGLVQATGQAAAQGGDAPPPQVGDYVRLGPLGTALLPYRLPRVLLIDELDQSDIDLPQQLRSVFEDGGFEIPELVRVAGRAPEAVVHTADPGRTATVRGGRVTCHEFPLVVMTCSEDRDFPAAFLRHCLRLRLPEAGEAGLASMVAAHFPDGAEGSAELIQEYLSRRGEWDPPAVDQLLDAVHLRTSGAFAPRDRGEWRRLIEALWRRLPPDGTE